MHISNFHITPTKASKQFSWHYSYTRIYRTNQKKPRDNHFTRLPCGSFILYYLKKTFYPKCRFTSSDFADKEFRLSYGLSAVAG